MYYFCTLFIIYLLYLLFMCNIIFNAYYVLILHIIFYLFMYDLFMYTLYFRCVQYFNTLWGAPARASMAMQD